MKTSLIVLLVTSVLVAGVGLIFVHLNKTGAFDLSMQTNGAAIIETPVLPPKDTPSSTPSLPQPGPISTEEPSPPHILPAPVPSPSSVPTPVLIATPEPTASLCPPSAQPAACPVWYVDPESSPSKTTINLVLYNNCASQISLPDSAPWHIEDSNGKHVYDPIAEQIFTFLQVGHTKTWTYNKIDNLGNALPVGQYVAVLDTSTHPRATFEVTH